MAGDPHLNEGLFPFATAAEPDPGAHRTDDTTFTLANPAFGATVASPVRVGGRISGVDESIRVQLRAVPGSSTAGAACCLPAGGEATPWSMTVSFAAPAGSLLVVATQTGRHVAGVERFAVTAVRAR